MDETKFKETMDGARPILSRIEQTKERAKKGGLSNLFPTTVVREAFHQTAVLAALGALTSGHQQSEAADLRFSIERDTFDLLETIHRINFKEPATARR